VTDSGLEDVHVTVSPSCSISPALETDLHRDYKWDRKGNYPNTDYTRVSLSVHVLIMRV
jgi:hypothetical protein